MLAVAREEGFRLRGRVWGRPLVEIGEPAPLVGTVFAGVIDRGTNVLQVRPTTLCPLSCIFCSVDAGPRSRWRNAEYVVEPLWLAEWVERVAREKGVAVEALIDGVGDPLTYPWIADLVSALKASRWVRSVALETHGAPLSKELIARLDRAGLDRINLSIETLDKGKARKLAGAEWFNVERVMRLIEYVVRETSIDVHVTPVWLPGINDNDVVEVVRWALQIGAGKRWPPATVQKYIRHRRGRNPRGVKEPSWDEFWRWLSGLEERLGVKLRYTMDEWGMAYAPRLPKPFSRGDTIEAVVVAPGWLKGELLAVARARRGERLVTILAPRGYRVSPGEPVRARIVSDKDNIFIARV